MSQSSNDNQPPLISSGAYIDNVSPYKNLESTDTYNILTTNKFTLATVILDYDTSDDSDIYIFSGYSSGDMITVFKFYVNYNSSPYVHTSFYDDSTNSVSLGTAVSSIDRTKPLIFISRYDNSSNFKHTIYNNGTTTTDSGSVGSGIYNWDYSYIASIDDVSTDSIIKEVIIYDSYLSDSDVSDLIDLLKYKHNIA
jgi:hypothetical protein